MVVRPVGCPGVGRVADEEEYGAEPACREPPEKGHIGQTPTPATGNSPVGVVLTTFPDSAVREWSPVERSTQPLAP